MPRSAWSVRLSQVNADAEGERDDRDADQVGAVGDPVAQRRVRISCDGRRAAEAAQPQRVGDDADRAHRHRGAGEDRVEQQAVHQYRAPAATGISSTL